MDKAWTDPKEGVYAFQTFMGWEPDKRREEFNALPTRRLTETPPVRREVRNGVK